MDRFLHSNNPNDISLEEDVRYCSSCGTIILKDDNFCENCGVPLEKE
ncbi:MAG: zinc-ribbon domain-containing protein [Candidatus Hodarchaeales archaeon]